jgi:hypothetical protein
MYYQEIRPTEYNNMIELLREQILYVLPLFYYTHKITNKWFRVNVEWKLMIT